MHKNVKYINEINSHLNSLAGIANQVSLKMAEIERKYEALLNRARDTYALGDVIDNMHGFDSETTNEDYARAIQGYLFDE